MPAVILVLALCLAMGQVASQQLTLQDAAAAAARGISRGETAATVNQRIRHQFPKASASRAEHHGLSCVTVRSPAALGPTTLTLTATSCALKEPGW